MNRTCQRCEKPLKWNQIKFCSRKCRDETAQRRIQKQCLTCGNLFEIVPSDIIYKRGKYCSPACFHVAHTEHMKEHPSNPRQRVMIVCRYCGKEIEAYKAVETRKHFCSKECSNASKRLLTGPNHPLYTKATKICEWCGKEYTCKNVHKDRSRFCSRQCQGASLALNHPKERTSIEITVEQILNELGIEYTAQKPMGVFICDFVLRRHKIVIECDGDYWHSNAKQKEKDGRKDIWLKNHRYHVIRLTERLIKADPEACKKIIQQEINH